VDGLIIRNYQAKLAQENAQIVSSKNRFEVNQELVAHQAHQKVVVPREKVTYKYGDQMIPEHEEIDSD